VEIVALGIDYGSKTSGFTAAAGYSSKGVVQGPSKYKGQRCGCLASGFDKKLET
jgi:hypothetical protein